MFQLFNPLLRVYINTVKYHFCCKNDGDNSTEQELFIFNVLWVAFE